MISKLSSSSNIAKLASALCFLSMGTADAGDIAPRLIKTTRPIRVKLPTNGMMVEPVRVSSSAIPGTMLATSPTVTAAQCPQVAPSPRCKQAVRVQMFDPSVQMVSDLRYLLEPGLASGNNIDSVQSGIPRVNQYVELQNDRVINPAEYTGTPSATLGHSPAMQLSRVRINPLMDDSLPKLRRFRVADRSLALFSKFDKDENAVAAQVEPLPERPAEDIESTYDALRSESTESINARSSAKQGGFGMLAIDQIGRHLEPQGTTNQDGQRALKRFANDLVMPDAVHVAQDQSATPTKLSNADSLRSHLGRVDSDALIESNVPLLPKPVAPLESPSKVALDLVPKNQDHTQLPNRISLKPIETSGTNSRSTDVSPGETSSSLSNDVGLELESLLRQGFGQSRKHVTLETKISASSRIAKPQSTANSDAEIHVTEKSLQEPPATRLSSPPKNAAIKSAIPVSSRSRPGGLLNQWFGRSRY